VMILKGTAEAVAAGYQLKSRQGASSLPRAANVMISSFILVAVRIRKSMIRYRPYEKEGLHVKGVDQPSVAVKAVSGKLPRGKR
jgi:hypothetical protein